MAASQAASQTHLAAARLFAASGSLLWLQAARAAVLAAPLILLAHVAAMRQLRASVVGAGLEGGADDGADAGAGAPSAPGLRASLDAWGLSFLLGLGASAGLPPLLSLDTLLVAACSLAWQAASLVLRVAYLEGSGAASPPPALRLWAACGSRRVRSHACGQALLAGCLLLAAAALAGAPPAGASALERRFLVGPLSLSVPCSRATVAAHDAEPVYVTSDDHEAARFAAEGADADATDAAGASAAAAAAASGRAAAALIARAMLDEAPRCVHGEGVTLLAIAAATGALLALRWHTSGAARALRGLPARWLADGAVGRAYWELGPAARRAPAVADGGRARWLRALRLAARECAGAVAGVAALALLVHSAFRLGARGSEAEGRGPLARGAEALLVALDAALALATGRARERWALAVSFQREGAGGLGAVLDLDGDGFDDRGPAGSVGVGGAAWLPIPGPAWRALVVAAALSVGLALHHALVPTLLVARLRGPGGPGGGSGGGGAGSGLLAEALEGALLAPLQPVATGGLGDRVASVPAAAAGRAGGDAAPASAAAPVAVRRVDLLLVALRTVRPRSLAHYVQGFSCEAYGAALAGGGFAAGVGAGPGDANALVFVAPPWGGAAGRTPGRLPLPHLSASTAGFAHTEAASSRSARALLPPRARAP